MAAADPRGVVPVALDVHALQMEGWADRGVGRYVAGYSAALARRGAMAAALLAPELPPAAGLPNELLAEGLVRWDTAATCRSLVEGAEGGGLAYHLTAPFLHTEPSAADGLGVVEHWSRAAVPRVVLLHDLIPLRAPRHYLHAAGHEERYRARARWVGTADLVLTNSEHTRQEALTLLGCDPDRVVTVGVGVSPYFSPPDGTDEELWRYHFPALAGRPHLVTVGGSDARKGTDRAVAAMGLLVARGYDLSLLVVGHLTPAFQEQLEQTARACGVADRVVLGGAVDDELLRACYRRAALSIMPSLAEGAGLPVLESAACGTPALASATTALAETAAVAAAQFDPTDVDSIADVIGAAVDSPGRREEILAGQRQLAARSTWEAVAERAVAAISAVVTGGWSVPDGGRAARPWARRLAVIGWPAAQPAAEDGALLSGLASAWDGEVDVVGPGGQVDPSAFGTEVRPASYDQVVYVFTGSEGDTWVLDLAGRHPGWLWLWDSAVPLRFPLEPLVRRSCGVLVGSDAAFEAVRLGLRPFAARPPVVLLPGGGHDPAALAAVLGS